MTPEQGNAHDAGDCSIDCEHPDHAFDSEGLDIDWLLELARDARLYGDDDTEGPVIL